MFGPANDHMKIQFTVVHVNNQFKIVGTLSDGPHVSTYTLDLQANVPRQFLDEDLPGVVTRIKDTFEDFMQDKS